ncbi:MAG: TIGR00269 family protein [Candidatus Nezhaarchaeota archaeon]|nr:TIGR00269 family protein [Candidatus Nezhaarchaeota archaeon]
MEEAKIRLNYARLSLCEGCFIKFIERKVARTVNEYHMIEKQDRILVAISGGKDSAALLHLIRRIIPDIEVTCLHIDLGIKGFSDVCRQKAEELAKYENVKLTTVSLEDFMGYRLDELVTKRRRICSLCGLVRRYLLNYYGLAYGATKIATGHNLDDAVAILWDFYVRGDLLEALKFQPVTKFVHPKAIPRIKPLIELTDFELKLYADVKSLPYTLTRCPFGRESKLNRRKKLIETIELMYPAFRHTFLKSHVKRVSPLLLSLTSRSSDWKSCLRCGMPSKGDLCGVCRVKESLNRLG